jgi:hypothetical protein
MQASWSYRCASAWPRLPKESGASVPGASSVRGAWVRVPWRLRSEIRTRAYLSIYTGFSKRPMFAPAMTARCKPAVRTSRRSSEARESTGRSQSRRDRVHRHRAAADFNISRRVGTCTPGRGGGDGCSAGRGRSWRKLTREPLHTRHLASHAIKSRRMD